MRVFNGMAEIALIPVPDGDRDEEQGAVADDQ